MKKRKPNKKVKLDRYIEGLIWLNEEMKKTCDRISKDFEKTLNQFDPEDHEAKQKYKLRYPNIFRYIEQRRLENPNQPNSN